MTVRGMDMSRIMIVDDEIVVATQLEETLHSMDDGYCDAGRTGRYRCS
jgi:CheY-like chemotaxis protein